MLNVLEYAQCNWPVQVPQAAGFSMFLLKKIKILHNTAWMRAATRRRWYFADSSD